MIAKKSKLSPKSLLQAHRLVAVVVVGAILIGGMLIMPLVRADQFDEQIKQLNQNNSLHKQDARQLGAQVANYQDAVNKLQQRINAVQAQIDSNRARVADLQKQIKEAEDELARQKKILGEDIRAMYVEGDITTLEMLASSKNLSEFVDKQQYRTSVQEKIKTTLGKINELKHQLKAQKEALEQTIKEQETLQAQLDAQRSEQARLLSLTVAQQTEVNQQIAANNAQIAELRAQQIAANARFIGGAGTGPACGGGYPAKWCEIPQDSVIDNWGMYNRECVSYTAFRVAASGRHMPYWGGVGNANQWDEDARAAGIPVDSSPRPGDVAISNSGVYGHAMYVESVNANGTINVSQYNAALDGRYSVRNDLSVGSLVFIHF